LSTKTTLAGNEDELKVFATFLKIPFEKSDMSGVLQNIQKHWKYIISAANSCETEESLATKLIRILVPLSGEKHSKLQESTSAQDAVFLLHEYASVSQRVLIDLISRTKKVQARRIGDIIIELNFSVITLLERLGAPERYTAIWRNSFPDEILEGTIIHDTVATMQ